MFKNIMDLFKILRGLINKTQNEILSRFLDHTRG